MRPKKRETEIYSLSFLDVICCGFGAIVLLLVLAEVGKPIVLERSRDDLDQQVKALTKQLEIIRGETSQLEREMKGRVDLLLKERRNLASAAAELLKVEGEFSNSRQNAAVSNILEQELLSAFQEIAADRERLSRAARSRKLNESKSVAGIQLDSDYVVFLIDNSPSMRNDHWETVIAVLQEILDAYPEVKGLQIVDDNGRELFSGTAGKWMKDSKVLRRDIISRMDAWDTFSDSNPVNGIEAVIRKYWSPDIRVGLYVFGDDFNGDSIQEAIDSIDRLNGRVGSDSQRRVRIHGIGFPAGPTAGARAGVVFPALMRAISERNNGTFIGLTKTKGCSTRLNIGGVMTCIGGN